MKGGQNPVFSALGSLILALLVFAFLFVSCSSQEKVSNAPSIASTPQPTPTPDPKQIASEKLESLIRQIKISSDSQAKKLVEESAPIFLEAAREGVTIPEPISMAFRNLQNAQETVNLLSSVSEPDEPNKPSPPTREEVEAGSIFLDAIGSGGSEHDESMREERRYQTELYHKDLQEYKEQLAQYRKDLALYRKAQHDLKPAKAILEARRREFVAALNAQGEFQSGRTDDNATLLNNGMQKAEKQNGSGNSDGHWEVRGHQWYWVERGVWHKSNTRSGD